MEPIKVSFGFSKLSKKTNIISNALKQEKDEKKIELIDCLEGKSIKVKDAVEEVKQELVIPLKDDQRNLLDRIRAAKKKDKKQDIKSSETEDTRPDSELTPDELVARQLLKEAKDRLANGHSSNNSKVSILPVKDENLSLEGEKEPTLEDYESVPISDYGLALLRGMGWKDGTAIGRNVSASAAVSVPELRPKGLGLGATKVVQSEIPTKKAKDKDGNELVLVKAGFAKVIAGPQKGNYCEIQGFDEEAGRVIIKVFPVGEIVNINELMLVPVTKDEFSKGSKVLNNAKYEEYKEKSDKKLDSYRIKSEPGIVKKEEVLSSDSEDDKRKRSDKHSSSKEELRGKYKSESTSSKYENEEKRDSLKYKERRNSPTDNLKGDRQKTERKSRSRSRDRSYLSSKYSKRRSKSRSASSDEDRHSKASRKYEKERSKDRSKSRSKSKYSDKKYNSNKYSSDEEYELKKKSRKHTKSKNRDKSRSRSRERSKKHKHSSKRDSSDSASDSDHKKDRRKKNKCKSRHRRSSSSSEDRRDRRKR